MGGHRQTDGRVDMTELIVAFRNSANAPKNSYSLTSFDMSRIIKFIFRATHTTKAIV